MSPKFQIGAPVKVVAGPFKWFSGVVTNVTPIQPVPLYHVCTQLSAHTRDVECYETQLELVTKEDLDQ